MSSPDDDGRETPQSGESSAPESVTSAPTARLHDESPDEVGPVDGVTLVAGDPLGDHYRVVRLLGSGGMGAVYLARDERLGRDVALKVRARSAALDLDRLRREATALAQLSHPNVVAVYEVAEIEGRVFVAMEYVDGWTLGEWLRNAPRGVDEILAVFVAAGRGLAAAHSAGLVHRDFKPANVLVGRDGRVRVADFGLARRAGELSVPVKPPASPVERLDTVTEHGTILGTPAYMAPEQLAGSAVDARTDQFAFCLSLHGALGGRSADRDAIERKEVSFDGTAGRRVPPWLRDLIRRGLRPNPDERFPSMDALLAELETTPRRLRVRRVAVGASLGLLALAAAAWWWWPQALSACPPATRRLAGVWDDGLRAQVSRAFLATHAPSARASLDTVVRHLDAYCAAWIGEQQRICEATHVYGEQSDQALDNRMVCMNDLLSDVQALGAVLAHADATVVENAGQAVETLIPIERCTGAEAKPFYRPIPKDATELARLEKAAQRLSGALILLKAGKTKQASAALDTLERDGLPDHPFLRARLAYVRATQLKEGGRYEEARAQLETSIRYSLASGNEHQLFTSMADLAWISGEESKSEDALRWLGFADAVSESLGRPSDIELALHNNATIVNGRLGRFPAALDHGRRCVELARERSDDLALARCLTVLSVAQSDAGDNAAASTSLSEALVLSKRQVGLEHSTSIRILGNLSITSAKAGDYAAARRYAQQAIKIRAALSGPDSIHLANLYEQLGAFAQEQGDLDTARDYLGRAQQIKLRNLGEDNLEVAYSLGNLAIVSLLSGRADEALSRAQHSRRIITAKLGPRHPYLINAHVIEGAIHRERGDLKSSEASLEKAVALADAVLPKGHPARANPRIELAKTALAQGRLTRALSLTREVQRICTGGKVGPREVADNEFTMAQVMWEIGDDRPGAVALARKAREAWTKMGLEQELADSGKWLDARSLPREAPQKP